MLHHDWDVSVPQAVELQRQLRSRLVPHAPPAFAPRLVAGADVSIEKFSTRGYAGIVVIDASTMQTVDEAKAAADIRFPYVPGLLSFRELPALQRAWDLLVTKPEALIFDGAGYAHPRRFGLACHGGVMLGIPTIGCAKSVLVGRHGPLADEQGASRPRAELKHPAAQVFPAERAREVHERTVTEPELATVSVPADGDGEGALAHGAQSVGRVHEEETDAVRAG